MVRPTTVTRKMGISPCGVTIVCWVGFGADWENAGAVTHPTTMSAAAIRWNMGILQLPRQQVLRHRRQRLSSAAGPYRTGLLLRGLAGGRAEDVANGVVAFVTRVFKHGLGGGLLQRQAERPRPRPGFRIVNRHFPAQRRCVDGNEPPGNLQRIAE